MLEKRNLNQVKDLAFEELTIADAYSPEPNHEICEKKRDPKLEFLTENPKFIQKQNQSPFQHQNNQFHKTRLTPEVRTYSGMGCACAVGNLDMFWQIALVLGITRGSQLIPQIV